ncbi:glycosyltransferase [Belnapia sp. F-4-1]|uniref:glycosyltransferase n=1 Tax=Belnapia sp. F-4-1 TaxID=1545443 RepID=UPI000A497B7B|nr:glycosyltransferase [Belnapia sp. F-4-1]
MPSGLSKSHDDRLFCKGVKMGELFEQVVPEISLEWTGERLTGGAGAQVEIEHLHRYLLARQLARGLDVLDVASGEGYGSAFIAQTARSVVGVELDPASVAHAARSYRAPNLRFVEGDARVLPVQDASVDLVVSFETIEHFYEHERFLSEIRRVLRPGGQLLISSPERDVYSPAGTPPNPFHIHELTRQEFATLLGRHFRHIQIQGQRTVVGSALISEGQGTNGHLTFERRGTRFEANDGLPRPVYLVALASDVSEHDLPNSLFVETSAIEVLLTEIPALRELSKQRSAALDEAAVYVRKLEAEIAERDRAAAETALAAQRTQRELNEQLSAAFGKADAYARKLEVEIAGRAAAAAAAATAAATAAAALAAERTAARKSRETAETGRLRAEQGLVAALSETQRLKELIDVLAAESEARRVALVAGARWAREMEVIASRVPELEAQLQTMASRVPGLEAQLQTVLFSGTWRATQPIRKALEHSPGVRRVARRAVKAVWWTVTLQLPSRLASRRAAAASLATLHSPVPPADEARPLQLETHGTAVSDHQPTDAVSPEPLESSQPVPTPNAAPEAKAVLGGFAAEELREFLASGEKLRFEHFNEPEVSVLIAVWNKAYFTLRCLRALLAAQERLEVIVVDNDSTDETAALLAQVEGIQVIRNKVNEGFLLATNRAAAAARGRDLLLLNSDAFVRPDAISAAVATLRSAPDIGAVGGRLVLPDGKLQEAGSIIWSDGSTQGYARDAVPEAGEAMFQRDVDYCSGAFLLTPRATWERLGGFDQIYAPAYYEEVDYCLRLREIGLRTVFEPDAVVDHFEFGSEGKRGDAVALSMRNRRTFRHRHATRLLTHHFPPAPGNVLIGRHATPARARRRLLVMDDFVPLNSLGSGFPRLREILAAIAAAGWSVTFYPTNQAEVDWAATRREIPREIEIVVNGGSPGLASFLAARAGYFDAVLVSRPHNMATLKQTGGADILAQSGTRVIYDAEALFSLREIEQARVLGTPLSREEADGLIRSELALCAGSDAVVCVSEEEAKVFREHLPETAPVPICVLSHPTTARVGAPGFDARHGFLFVGRLLEKTAPNWDGLLWFIRECWPAVREALPGVTLTVAGRVHQEHEELLQPGVRLVGSVDNLGPLYDAARIFVAPIRFAAGVPIKILEATAAGLPCAGTRLMARQMTFDAGVEMVAEDNPEALAREVVALYGDAAAWTSMRDAAGVRISREHGADHFRQALRRVLDEPADAFAKAACIRVEETSADQTHEPQNDARRIARVAEVWGGALPQPKRSSSRASHSPIR